MWTSVFRLAKTPTMSLRHAADVCIAVAVARVLKTTSIFYS